MDSCGCIDVFVGCDIYGDIGAVSRAELLRWDLWYWVRAEIFGVLKLGIALDFNDESGYYV